MQSHLRSFLFDPNFNLGTDSLYSSQSTIAGLSPLQLGAVLWLDASDPSNNGILPANNTALSPWIDKTGNGFNATNGTPARRPHFILNDSGTPTVTASSASSQIYTLAPITLTATTTIVAVASISAGTPGYLLHGTNTGDTPTFLYGFSDNSFEWFNSPDRQTFASVTSGYHMLTITQTDGVNLTGYFDGVQMFSVIPVAILNTRQLTGFFTSTTLLNFYNGSMKTFIVFNKVLSKTQLTSLFSYISQRYNVVG
jgi:hypothetical protein